MTKTEKRARMYQSMGSAFEDGAAYMLKRVLNFMREFKDGDGNHPLYDYIGNVRKAMEE